MDKDQKKEIGVRIRTLRNKIGLTQSQVAEKLGVDRVSISNYEIGRAVPPGDILIILAELFNTSTDYLLGNKENPDPVDAEAGFVNSLDLSDDDVLDKWDIEMDGEQLSKEQINLALAFLRTLRQSEHN